MHIEVWIRLSGLPPLVPLVRIFGALGLVLVFFAVAVVVLPLLGLLVRGLQVCFFVDSSYPRCHSVHTACLRSRWYFSFLFAMNSERGNMAIA